MNKTPDLISELRAEIQSAPPGELPGIIGQLEAVKAEAFARLVTPQPCDGADDDDRLLTVDDVAAQLGETSRWVRDHQDDLPRVKLPGRSLRFSAKRMASIIKRRSYG